MSVWFFSVLLFFSNSKNNTLFCSIYGTPDTTGLPMNYEQNTLTFPASYKWNEWRLGLLQMEWRKLWGYV